VLFDAETSDQVLPDSVITDQLWPFVALALTLVLQSIEAKPA
jgi:hypothetical protein